MILEREALRPLGQSYPVDFSDQSLRSIVKINCKDQRDRIFFEGCHGNESRIALNSLVSI